jgi:nucleotide-binding universal stress UspA family protein
MTEGERDEPIRRILIALDASPNSLSALRTAAELADLLQAELVGLYVEDINLLRMAEMPFAREYSLFRASPQQITRSQIEQQLRTQARQARRALEAAAQPRHLRWSFRVLQGVITLELLSAAEDTDLIILGRTGWSHRKRLGSTARVVVRQSVCQALVLGRGAHLGLPVGLIYDGSELGRRTVQSALRMLRQREGYLVVFILAPTVEEARRWQAEAAEMLRARGLHIHFRWLVKLDSERLQGIVQTESLGMLLLPGEDELFDNDALQDLLDWATFPIWIVR